jgi:hypothetical protein
VGEGGLGEMKKLMFVMIKYLKHSYFLVAFYILSGKSYAQIDTSGVIAFL